MYKEVYYGYDEHLGGDLVIFASISWIESSSYNLKYRLIPEFDETFYLAVVQIDLICSCRL